MRDNHQQERWKDLCQAAQKEKDSKKLMDLITQIDKELEKAGPSQETALAASPAQLKSLAFGGSN